jgi:hypothetical protein
MFNTNGNFPQDRLWANVAGILVKPLVGNESLVSILA